MLSIKDVAKSLGLSTRGVYHRLNMFDGRLNPHLTRGSNNEILFNSSALALLQRMEALRKTEGISIREAVKRVNGETDGERVRSVYGKPDNPLVEELRARVKWLEQENVWLRERLDVLTPQLSAGRHRWWRLFKRP
jgi:hypothetical protein